MANDDDPLDLSGGCTLDGMPVPKQALFFDRLDLLNDRDKFLLTKWGGGAVS